ncbi:uncharacterized protein isoform X2 [Rhodnius prolixus]|uniref:Putative insect cuticle protein n=2 Tax=Rhodnius prolixus TaxID=13249 RepID=R4G7Q5_RHOPR
MIARLTAFVLLLLVGRASLQLLRPVQGIVNTAVNLISYVNENYGQDGYKFMYATDDQTVREEKGEFVNGIWTVTGLVKWLSPDKKTEHTVKYKADDTGYHTEQESRISPGVIASLAG